MLLSSSILVASRPDEVAHDNIFFINPYSIKLWYKAVKDNKNKVIEEIVEIIFLLGIWNTPNKKEIKTQIHIYLCIKHNLQGATWKKYSIKKDELTITIAKEAFKIKKSLKLKFMIEILIKK